MEVIYQRYKGFGDLEKGSLREAVNESFDNNAGLISGGNLELMQGEIDRLRELSSSLIETLVEKKILSLREVAILTDYYILTERPARGT